MEYLNGGDLMFHIQEKGRFELQRATWVSPVTHFYSNTYTHTHTAGFVFLLLRGVKPSKWTCWCLTAAVRLYPPSVTPPSLPLPVWVYVCMWACRSPFAVAHEQTGLVRSSRLCHVLCGRFSFCHPLPCSSLSGNPSRRYDGSPLRSSMMKSKAAGSCTTTDEGPTLPGTLKLDIR